jgi:FkbM family methyltransferase
VITRGLRFFRKLLQIPIYKKVGNVYLWLPPEHLLPIYKQKNRLYDSFLPVLANRLPARSTVIDVGANIGDTCKSMYISNLSLNFLCVEPDPKFFKYLKFNTRRIPKQNIFLHKLLVTESSGAFKLVGKGGSKSMQVTNQSSIKTTTLDSLCSKIRVDSQIGLIKSDVDGFDFDVLLSGRSVISERRPLVFAEFSFVDSSSLSKYLNVVNFLINAKYSRAFIFRNTGGFECSIDLNQLEDFLRKNVNSSNQFVGVSYFDIMFSAENFLDIAKLAIDDFRKL